MINSAAMSGYVFEPDELRTTHDEWAELLDDLRKDMEQALTMINILAPGREPASETMAASGHDAGTEFRNHSLSMQGYVEGFVNKLGDVRAEYLHEEESAAARFPTGGLL